MASLKRRPLSSLISVLAIDNITSPRSKPAEAAGPDGYISFITVPLDLSNPKAEAITESTALVLAPIQGRTILPSEIALSTARETSSAGIANPIPLDPPDRENIAVFTPINSPVKFTKAPPEFPGFTAASV